MKQSVNEVCIEGIVQSIDIISGTDKNNQPFLRGNVIVNVDQNYNGNDEHEEVKVSFYSGKYTHANTENPAYKSIETLKNFKRISTDGDQADGIRITRGTISEYAYKPNDVVVTGWQANSSFFTKIPAAGIVPRATFKNEVFIREIADEIGADGEPTGRLKVTGILIGYHDRADVVTYYAEDPKCIDVISKHWNEGDTVTINGRIRTCVMMSQAAPKDDNGFGEEVDTGVSRVRKELIITGGTTTGEEPGIAFEENDVRMAMGERMNRINAIGATSRPAPITKKATRGW